MAELSTEQQAAQLAAGYLNRAGAISCQFVIKFKKMTVEVQTATNKKLIELGHPPYDLSGRKKSKDRTPRAPRQPSGGPKVLNDEQKQGEAVLVHILDEIRLDREAIHRFTTELGIAEDNTREQLAKLRGVPYDGPLHDPFKAMYKPARQHSRHNKTEVEASTKCGCFFCRATFDPKAIYTYVEGDTAICPNCGMDAVIGDVTGFELSDEFLVAMFRQWFSIPIRLRAARPIGVPKPAPQVPQVSTEMPLLQTMDKQEFVVPPHLEETVPAGIGAALVGSLVDDGDDEDEEEEEQHILPMPVAPKASPVDEDEDEDDEDDDDWDDDEDEEDWDDDEDEEDD